VKKLSRAGITASSTLTVETNSADPIHVVMTNSAAELGAEIRRLRKLRQATQQELARASGTGVRFIGDLENGKPTCQLSKVLATITALGFQMSLTIADTNPTHKGLKS